jgi:probable rRNA maturation factor
VALQVAAELADELPREGDFAAWVNAALSGSGAELPSHACVTIRIVDREESSALNGSFRSVHKATNVLAFPVGDHSLPVPEQGENELGDLVICHDVVMQEAAQQGKTVRNHLAHLAVHGALHLVGYDHDSDAEAEKMESLETRILGSLAMPDPYADEPGVDN